VLKRSLRKWVTELLIENEALDPIKAIGSLDIIAEKDSLWVIAEVKPLNQLVRYENKHKTNSGNKH